MPKWYKWVTQAAKNLLKRRLICVEINTLILYRVPHFDVPAVIAICSWIWVRVFMAVLEGKALSAVRLLDRASLITQEARVALGYTSFVLSKLPACFISRRSTLTYEPVVKFIFLLIVGKPMSPYMTPAKATLETLRSSIHCISDRGTMIPRLLCLSDMSFLNSERGKN